MNTDENVQVVKDFFAAFGRGEMDSVRSLSAENIEWIIPGKNWPLAGTHCGHAGLANLLQTASATMETSSMELREFVAQGDRVLVIGFARGNIKATNKTWEDHWVFSITVRNGKLRTIREYIDTQALGWAAQADPSPLE
jgi:ketosteroid isomerase-like protein